MIINYAAYLLVIIASPIFHYYLDTFTQKNPSVLIPT